MEPQETTTLSQPSASRLAFAAGVSILAGIGLFILCLALEHGSTGLWFSAALLFGLAPALGLLAVVSLACVWRRGTSGHDGGDLRGARRRFGRVALLFALVSLLVMLTVPPSREWLDHATLAHVVDLWFAMPAVLAVMLGGISFSLLTKSDATGFGRLGALSAITVGLAAVILQFAVPFAFYLMDVATYRGRSMSFSGDSSGLKQTAVVATLDCPIPTGQNVIWCSSFQLAWNALRDNVLGNPALLTSAGDLANRLNGATASQDDLDASSYFVTAGLARDNIQDHIKTQMVRRFPGVSPPACGNLGPNDLVMYAYLQAEIKFRHPFENDCDGMEFTDSSGHVSPVASFGVWDDSPRYDKQREQVQVLYHSSGHDPNDPSGEPNQVLLRPFWGIDEFAVDLCRHAQLYQIVLARIDPRPTLAQTLADLDQKIARFANSEDYDQMQRLHEADRLFVPEMFWEIEHRFADLEGRSLANPGSGGALVKLAEQVICFRLDRCGAVLKSRATLVVTLGLVRARTFSFDQPFLLYMKKRDAERPFFVMWVDNAELLVGQERTHARRFPCRAGCKDTGGGNRERVYRPSCHVERSNAKSRHLARDRTGTLSAARFLRFAPVGMTRSCATLREDLPTGGNRSWGRRVANSGLALRSGLRYLT